MQPPPGIVSRVLRDGRVPEDTIQNKVRLVKDFFDNTLPHYEGSIAILHLDCDLYGSYKVALECLYENVVPGGVIMFDEYENATFPGARRAIDEFFADKEERVLKHHLGKWFAVKLR